MDDLQEKCPWDKKQDLQSLRHLTLRRVYELSDALLEENLTEIKKELGDVFCIWFYIKLVQAQFDIADVINSFNEKLIFRHPSHLWKCRSERRRRSETKLGKTEVKRKQVYFSRSSEKFANYQSMQNSGKSKRNRF